MIAELKADANSIKQAQTDHSIHPLLSQRWSPRAFAARPVEPDQLRSLFEAARWSASAGNGQSWSFIVATQDDRDTFDKIAQCLDSGNAAWAPHAPVLVLGIARTMRNDKPHKIGLYDLGLAVQNLTVQASALDLFVHQMGGFSRDAARTTFQIPDDHEPIVVMAIGYLGDPMALDERNRSRELEPRSRKPLQEFVFSGVWGETAALVK